jgi:hypothetical protein
MYEAGRRSDAKNGRAAAGLAYRRRGGVTADSENVCMLGGAEANARERERERERSLLTINR